MNIHCQVSEHLFLIFFCDGPKVIILYICPPIGPFKLQPLFLKGVEKSFEKSGLRKMVLQTWIFLRKVVDQKKRWVYTINPPFFRLEESGSANSDFFSGSRKVVDQKKKSDFSEPLFYTFLEKCLRIKCLIGFALPKNFRDYTRFVKLYHSISNIYLFVI